MVQSMCDSAAWRKAYEFFERKCYTLYKMEEMQNKMKRKRRRKMG